MLRWVSVSAVLRYALLPVHYASTVTLELTAVAPLVDLNPSGARVDELTVDTDALVVESDAVVEAVAEALGGTPGSVRESLSVDARPLTRVLEITYTTTESAEAAREGAAIAAESYLDLREELIIEPVRAYLSGIATATDELEATAPKDGNVTKGDTALEARRRAAEAHQVVLAGPGSVLQSATAPIEGRGGLAVVLASYAAVGGLLGFGAGLFAEHRERQRALHRGRSLPTGHLDAVAAGVR